MLAAYGEAVVDLKPTGLQSEFIGNLADLLVALEPSVESRKELLQSNSLLTLARAKREIQGTIAEMDARMEILYKTIKDHIETKPAEDIESSAPILIWIARPVHLPRVPAKYQEIAFATIAKGFPSSMNAYFFAMIAGSKAWTCA